VHILDKYEELEQPHHHPAVLVAAVNQLTAGLHLSSVRSCKSTLSSGCKSTGKPPHLGLESTEAQWYWPPAVGKKAKTSDRLNVKAMLPRMA
jgi:hypothetical protein